MKVTVEGDCTPVEAVNSITGAKTKFEGGSAKVPSTKMLAPVLPLFHTVAVRQLAFSRV